VQDWQAPLDVFVGREAELGRVAEVITRVESGQPWLVAIEGEPGMGKTTLARRCLAQACGLRVLSARGGQAEADLDFGIVDQLLRTAGSGIPPVLAGWNGSPASSFAVGARLLEVVGEQQAAGPVAIVVDDLQWADCRSVEALTFMLRRLSVDPVIAIVIYRGPGDRLDEATQRMQVSVENRVCIPLGGLGPGEVASLAAALRAGALDDEAVQWLHRRTGGHPLYLRTVLSDGSGFDPRAPGPLALPRSLAATVGAHLRWASDVSPDRAGCERRLLTAALHLTVAEETRGAVLRQAVEETAPSPLRSCVLATMAVASGQFAEAELQYSEALAGARADPGSGPLAAMIAARLAATYGMVGAGTKVQALGRWALGTGFLDAAAASQTRALIAIGVSQVAGPQAALAELAHLAADPARIGPVDADGLTSRGTLRLQAGDLSGAISDMIASVKLARRGATMVLGVRAYYYLALAQYLAGQWDEALLSAGQGLSVAAIHSRRFERPRLHLAAACVPAGRGVTEEAERHAAQAEQAADSLDYGQETVYAAMALALVRQAAGDYLGMADALGPWQDGSALDGRTRGYAALWPLLAEGLIGSGQLDAAATVLEQLRADNGQVGYLAPALAWLDGWLAEQHGRPEQALQAYARGDTASTGSPVYMARLLLAHGRLLRRTGNRKDAVDRLRRASDVYRALRAAPFAAQAEEELAACGFPGGRASKQPALTLTSRETEVAHLVAKGLTNREVAAELFISQKAVEYHLGNIYAKCGLGGRQQLRGFVEQWHQPASA
jgi:DNA-binding NarL/FixJ family response regulator